MGLSKFRQGGGAELSKFSLVESETEELDVIIRLSGVGVFGVGSLIVCRSENVDIVGMMMLCRRALFETRLRKSSAHNLRALISKAQQHGKNL